MRRLFLIPILFCLVACEKKEETIFSCPQTGFIKNYDVIDLKNKDILVSIGNIKGDCEPVARDDDKKRKDLEVELTIPFRASNKSKTMAGQDLDINYAVSVLNPEEVLLSKKIFSTKLSFDSEGLAGNDEEHTIKIPMDSIKKAHRYKIIISFINQSGMKK